jgi:hypothetical protein
MYNPYQWIKDVARSIFFDNSSNGFSSNNVQQAIEEIGASASPGFSWGRSGGLLSSTWLQVDGGVPSNSAGRYVPIASPVVALFFCSSDTVSTFTLTVYEHDGNAINLNAIGTLTITAARGGNTGAISWPTSQGKQLAVRLTAGSANNLVAGAILKGVNP